MTTSLFINNHIEIRQYEDGSIDEIVYTDSNGECVFHLEQMDDHYFWSRFYSTKQLPLEKDVIVYFQAHIEDGQPVAKIIHDMDASIHENEHLAKDDGLLKIVMGSLIKRFGKDAVERVLHGNGQIDDVVEVFTGETVKEAQEKRHARIKEIQAEFKKDHTNDIETPAQGQKGFLLYSPIDKKHFFRIYDPVDKNKFTDYKLASEDIEVEILDNFTAFYVNENGDNRLDWSSKVLGRKK